MRVKKAKFDAVLRSMLKQNPTPREKIKTKGKRGPKTPILQNPLSESDKEASRRSKDS